MFSKKIYAIALALFLPQAATAGNDNVLMLLQESAATSNSGNSIFIDQSASRNSSILGPEGGAQPAFQIGGGNNASITLKGSRAQVFFGQSNPNGDFNGNTATLLVTGASGLANLSQAGDGNLADVTVNGFGSQGIIEQNGFDNTGSVRVSGKNVTGTLTQTGTGNEMSFSVTGNGTTASYIQTGSNLTAVSAMPSVVSNGATVTITQTNLSGN